MKKELKPLLVDIGLSSVINSTVAMLSGGMKRRLSLVVALIGPPKVNKDGSHGHKYISFINVLSIWSQRLVECGSSVEECRTLNRESHGTNPHLMSLRSLCIFVLFTTP